MRPLTLDTILAATDLSAAALPALRSAVQLAYLADANLHVVHATAVADAAADDALTRALERHLRVADPDSTVLPGTTIRSGSADHVIVDTARSIDADLIVLGPHRRGRSGPPGGTSYLVAAMSERPCLVLPFALRLPLGRILVPIDASGAARGALATAMTWASALRRRQPQRPSEATEVVAMHVESPGPDDPSAHVVIESAVADVTARVAQLAGVGVRRLSEQGEDAAARIIERAAVDDVDLVVLGTRARMGAASRLGSVSSAVIETAACPLLLVPPRLWRRLGEEPLP